MGIGSAKICAALVVLCAASAMSRAALAQAPPPANAATPVPQPALVAPVLSSKPEVPYPDGAHGDAAVVLELLVDATGSVSESRVVTGDEPFASVALEHASELHFTPAMRGGTAVAARIRVEISFHEPVSPARAAPPAADRAEPNGQGEAAAPPAPTASRPAPPTIQIVVTGEAIEAEKVVLTGAEVRQLPGAFGDAFRAIEAMPGVTPIFSGVPFFYVRGAPPGNLGYFLDGVRVPLLYHFALGPSVINPALVDRVELFPGGYPARYGRYAGGIVAAETKPPQYELHGEGNIRVFDAGALVEGPVGDRTAVLVGGRYSYTAAVLSLLAPEVSLEYWDYQARVAYRATRKDTLSAFSFGAYDFLGQDRRGTTETLASTQFHRVDLRWDREVSSQTRFRLAATLGQDQTFAGEDEFELRDRSVHLRTEVTHRADSKTTFRLGADAGIDDYVVLYRRRIVSGIEEPPPGPAPDPGPPGVPPPTDPAEQPRSDEQQVVDLLPPRQDLTSGMWAEVAWRAAPRVQITPGLRLDYYVIGSATAFALEPRLSALYDVTPSFRIKHALGLAHQPPSFVVPVPGFAMTGLEDGLQQSIQASSGVELDLPARFTSSLTLFDNVFLHMTDFLSQDQDGDASNFQSRSLGSAIGLEFMVRRALTERLGGFVSYTLSRSTRSAGSRHYLARFDRTHVFNLALGYDLGRRWRAGGRLFYYSGFLAEYQYSATVDNSGNYRLNSRFARTSPFYRVDLRLEKRWRLGKTGHWAFVIEFLNATLNKEPIGYDCSSPLIGGSGAQVTATCTEEKVGPVSIPSIGVEAAF
jgi:hypothetical protein